MTSIFGKTHDDKMTAFDVAISAIEKKYHDQLQTDKLLNHYILEWEPTKYGIIYQLRLDTYLSEEVREEIASAFQGIFFDK